MGNSIRIAGIQMAPSAAPEKTVSTARSLIELAGAEGAKIVCLPQFFNTPFFPSAIDTGRLSLAQNEDGPAITGVKEAALKAGAVVIAPVFEESEGEYFNTAFIIGADGKTIGRYRKVHVPQIPLWEERAYLKGGDLGFPVFQTPFGRLGVQICWDVFFPEGFRALALKGAEIVFAPTASAFHHSHRKWERAVLAAAHANGFFVFRVNRVGKEDKQEFYGRSFCAGPDGEFVLKPSGSSSGVILADVDLSDVAAARSEWVFLKDRRPAEYRLISEG